MLVTPNKSRGDYGPHASFRMAALFAMLCFEFVLFQEVQSAIPNTCYRCDFQGGKKVKACPGQGFNTTGMEVAECSYEKPYCGLTINVTDTNNQQVIFAGCYTKPYNKYCFRDLVWHYGPINSSYCFHTCPDYFCNPYTSWSKRTANDSDLSPNNLSWHSKTR